MERHARRDKIQVIDNLTEEADTEASKQDKGTLYKITKLLTRGFTSNDTAVNILQGYVIASQKEKLVRWRKHFEKVLNRDDLSIDANKPPLARHQLRSFVVRESRACNQEAKIVML